MAGDSFTTENTVPPAPPAPRKFEFLGSYSHSIDAKGRIIIPNAYRDMLGDYFTVGPTRNFKGIGLYPNEAYNAILEELNRLNQSKPVVEEYTEQFYKLSYREMQADIQGRVLLPPKLRTRFLGEARDLEISGANNCVRVVAEEKANNADQYFMAHLPEILEEIGNQNHT